MSLTNKLLSTLVVVGVAGSLVAFASFSAFSSQTTNSGNTFAAGTVAIGDNDAGAAMYSLTNQSPDTTVKRCIRVTYTGTLASTVKLYASQAPGAGANDVNLVIRQVTGTLPAFPACTGLVDGTVVYTGTLGAFATARTSFANGLAVNDQSASAVWDNTDAVIYQFELTVPSASPQGTTTGTHAFQWESQNN